MDKRGQAEVIGDLIKTIIGVFIFLILIGGTWAIYQAFFAEKISPDIKDRDLALQTLESLLPGRSQEVITTCSVEGKCSGYVLTLYPAGNDVQGCNGVACLCSTSDEGVKCKRLDVVTDCKSTGACVNAVSTAQVAPFAAGQVGKPVIVCRKDNALFIGDGC